MIHPTAIVDSTADIAPDVEIGPYSIVKADVTIESGTIIDSHVTIGQFTHIGPDCKIFQYTSIGAPPQDLKFKGEKTVLKVGRGTVIREFATVNRGTGAGGGVTELGEENFLMAYCHVAHDCKTGRNVILANAATLAGHVELGDRVFIGGFTAIQQFVRIGAHAYVGGKSAVVKDVPPYVWAAGDRAKLFGLNSVGLKRAGFTADMLSILSRAYKILFRQTATLQEGFERIEAELEPIPELETLVGFLKTAERGITR
jgi:UDP-N-acetylglucosamine acyltransferase